MFRALALLLSLFLAAHPAQAKRSEPKPVAPVAANGIAYSAPHDQMGFVIATDTASRKELWRERIYSVQYDADLEKDVQDVFITSLALEGGMLVVTNERGAVYHLDLATRRVTKRK
ncbi:MAG TPA: hypothetical protein VGO11_14615 [Chthoniobacteraceae bacterium]|nr:hypothetical protein [Chthoniobacteraceae bacterium]